MKDTPIILLIASCILATISITYSVAKKKDIPKDFRPEIERFESMNPAEKFKLLHEMELALDVGTTDLTRTGGLSRIDVRLWRATLEQSLLRQYKEKYGEDLKLE